MNNTGNDATGDNTATGEDSSAVGSDD